MTAYKTMVVHLVGISALLLSTPTQALDGAALYVDRACIACHGAQGREPVMTEYPKIAGQNAAYMVAQMKDIKSGSRDNSHAVAMTNMMHMISDEEMAAVAEWLETLPY
ncbi:MAG: c-type cytochrome [Sedimenticola sp.]